MSATNSPGHRFTMVPHKDRPPRHAPALSGRAGERRAWPAPRPRR